MGLFSSDKNFVEILDSGTLEDALKYFKKHPKVLEFVCKESENFFIEWETYRYIWSWERKDSLNNYFYIDERKIYSFDYKNNKNIGILLDQYSHYKWVRRTDNSNTFWKDDKYWENYEILTEIDKTKNWPLRNKLKKLLSVSGGLSFDTDKSGLLSISEFDGMELSFEKNS